MLQFAIGISKEVPFSQRIEWWLSRRCQKFHQEVRDQGSIVRELPDSVAKHTGYKLVRITLQEGALSVESAT